MTPQETAPLSTIEALPTAEVAFAQPEEQNRHLTLKGAIAIGSAVIASFGVAKAATVSAEAIPSQPAKVEQFTPRQSNETEQGFQFSGSNTLAFRTTPGAGTAIPRAQQETTSKPDPTKNLPSIFDPAIKRWQQEINARCPAQLAVSRGHSKQRLSGNSLELTRKNDKNVFTLKLKENTVICANEGITDNLKVRRSILKFYKRSHGLKYYRYLDKEYTGTYYSTREVDVALRPKR